MKRTYIITYIVVLLIATSSLFLYTGSRISNVTLFSVIGPGTAFSREQRTAQVIFKVRCYDEGKTALQGLQGIQRIDTGYHYLHETDTVYFDPKVITVEEMEAALKKAGTYIETISGKERN